MLHSDLSKCLVPDGIDVGVEVSHVLASVREYGVLIVDVEALSRKLPLF